MTLSPSSAPFDQLANLNYEPPFTQRRTECKMCFITRFRYHIGVASSVVGNRAYVEAFPYMQQHMLFENLLLNKEGMWRDTGMNRHKDK